MSKIESLDSDTWARVIEERERWRAIGCSTAPADRKASERIFKSFYRRIDKPEPHVFWVDGPLSACLAGAMLGQLRDQLGGQLEDQLRGQLGDQLRGQLRAQLRGQLEDQLWDQLGDQLRGQLGAQLRAQLEDQLWDQLGDQLRGQLGGQLRGQLRGQLGDQLRGQLRGQLWDQLWDQLGDQLWDQLWDQLGDQLWGQLGDQLRGQLRGQLWDQLRGQLGDQLWGQLWGQLWDQLGGQLEDQLRGLEYGQEQAYWVAHYSVARDVIGVSLTSEISEALDEWATLAMSCGWWIPLGGLVIACERYRSAKFDDRRLLHCEDGPAIECRDGYKVYAWHGQRVPASWIEERNSLDPTVALTWENVEQRRAAAEIIGWHRVLKQLPTTTIDEDADPTVGKLLAVDIPDIGTENFLVVKCGTGRTFALPVPPDKTTALEANAWTYGVEPDIIRAIEVRT